jgi:MoxR-like ATPase
MDTVLLFRKRTPLTDDRLPWLRGSEEHSWAARRNTSGKGVVSAILVRALLSALEGSVLEAGRSRSASHVRAVVRSHSTPDTAAECWLDWSSSRCGVPHGEATKVTYHLGVLSIVHALADPDLAGDFWQAYTGLLGAFRQYGRSAEIKEPLCRAADELYFWLRYGPADPDSSHSRLEALQIGPQRPTPDTSELFSMNVNPLTDPDALRALLGNEHAPDETAPVAAEEPVVPGGFVGWQAAALAEALASGDNILLAGPTGTGKTFALHQVVQRMDSFLVTIEGKEGLTDLDFIGAILPQEDGSRRWIDGPLLRAMRQARLEPVLLFLDEVNRIPRVHLNILLGLMNPKSGQACRHMGMDMGGKGTPLDEGPFYIVEAPMTSEIVACPAERLRIVAAGNFGRAYQVYDLDPAVRRRFDTVIEFDYLEYRDELALVRREAPDLGVRAVESLVKLAQETRRLLANGEMPGCVDTASLLNWAKKCERSAGNSLSSIMQAAKLTWSDTVCGRDHTGRVNQGAFKALEDYLSSLAIL